MPAALPEYPAPSLLGHWRAMRDAPHVLFESGAQALGDVASFRVFHRRVTLFRHPDHVRQVLQEKVDNYRKQALAYTQLRHLLGNGLVTSEGAFWLRQRRIAQPAFHKKRIAAFGRTMVDLTEQMLARWSALPEGATLDVAREMMALTLRIVGHTLLSTEVGQSSAVVGQSMAELLGQMPERTTSPIQLPLFVPTPRNRRFIRARAAIYAVVDGIIAERRRAKARPEDLLSMLMDARDDETGEAMTDEQLRDEVMTMFLAGHETTANALAWTFYLLSEHPPGAARLHAELDEALGGRPPTVEDLPRLGYTARVVSESLRLYPPVWILLRRAEHDDVVGGHAIRAGSHVAVSAWVTQRDARFFVDPQRFDPDRFLPERLQSVPRFAYFPFSGGPRQCIGSQFALMEAQLVLATVAQAFAPTLVPDHPVEPHPSVTLRPRDGLICHLRRRTHCRR